MMRAASVVLGAIVAVFAGSSAALGQEGGGAELRGTVVSATSGDVVAGAWIALEDQDWGTISWNDGHFFLPQIPGRPMTYDVKALGYETEQVTLDPATSDLVVGLTPDPEVLSGLASVMAQIERRRNRGGHVQVFDQEALAFNAAFDLGSFLSQHDVSRPRAVCLNEAPAPVGVLERQPDQFYLVERSAGMLRVYTQDFVERAAKERLELQREPQLCSGPVNAN